MLNSIRVNNGALIKRVKLNIDLKGVKTFFDISEEYSAIAVVGLKKKKSEDDDLETINSEKENVRAAAAEGASALHSLGINDISIDTFSDPEAAAEGSILKLWCYNELKNKEDRKEMPILQLYPVKNEKDKSLWNVGLIKGEAQNLARRLTDTPANLMTPTIFAENAVNLFKNIPSVEIKLRDKAWAENQKMNCFLSVAKSSSEPPLFLEVHYKGNPSDDKPVVLVGKGITFDTGGVNIKPTSGLTDMRGDKGGAACVLATTYAAAKLGLPINVIALIPLCENMVGGNATKPGDVITAMNGKTVRVDNTDAEGRLILADALNYAKIFNPRFIIDVATLTGAMVVALGGEATGVFTNSNCLWDDIQTAGIYTGDRMWRFPLWSRYGKNLKEEISVDITNVGKGSMGGACSAAAFLREFVPPVDWMHLDIAGVMGPNYQNAYIGNGMTGRPTRTLIQFLMQIKK